MSQIASSTRLAICAEVKDLLLSVTQVVSDTNTACGEQSVDRKGKSLTHDRLERDVFLINSCVTGGEILQRLPAHFQMPAYYFPL